MHALDLSAVLSLLAHQIVVCTCRFEGPVCTIDINECARGTDNCAANAACINTQGMCGCEVVYYTLQQMTVMCATAVSTTSSM